ncbi:MAG: asparagine synthetase B [Methanobrevibacter sp.]|jgi:asparagine synthase (glutamine-hydrolysing)|nr:asparagine synthetase B [Methanobrevibacter sp.]
MTLTNLDNIEFLNNHFISFNGIYLSFLGKIYNFKELNKFLINNNDISNDIKNNINLNNNISSNISNNIDDILNFDSCNNFNSNHNYLHNGELLIRLFDYYFKAYDNINNNSNNSNSNKSNSNNSNSNKSNSNNSNSNNSNSNSNCNNANNSNNHSSNLILMAAESIIPKLNGDFLFCLFDGENTLISRDFLGNELLFYGFTLNLKSDDLNQLKNIHFAQNRKTLWMKGISDVKTLKPSNVILNGCEIKLKSQFFSTNIDSYQNQSYSFYKENLKKLIYNSILKRVYGLSKVGVIFSGGVDSTIVSQTLKKIAIEKNIEYKLYTIGTENSKDLKIAKQIADDLNFPLKTLTVTDEMIKGAIKPILDTIEEADIVKIGVGLAVYFATRLVNTDDFFGENDKKVVLTGQGADELFGGYNRFLETYRNRKDYLKMEFKHDIENMYHVNIERDVSIASSNNTTLMSPFLDLNLINFALNIPLEYKIKSGEDLLRKHILRDIAIDMGIPPYVALRGKKAAQYGSGIHKILMKKVLKDFDFEDYLKNLKNEYLD